LAPGASAMNDRAPRLRLKGTPLLLGVLVATASLANAAQALDFKTDCREVADVDVTARDEIRPGEPLATVRDRVSHMLDAAAIKQGIGETVSSRTGYQMNSASTEAGSKTEERMANRIRSQAAGFARQKIVGEKTVNENGRDYLVLDSKAQVCVPKSPALVKEVVRLGPTVNVQNAPLPEFHDLLASVFSASAAFAVAQPDDPFADHEIRGKIDRIELVELPVPAGEAPDAKRTRVNVSITVEATSLDSDEIVSATVADFKIFTRAGDPETQASDVARSIMRKAIDELHNKLLKGRSADNPAAVDKAMVNKPVEW
jgi:hypothetical protein